MMKILCDTIEEAIHLQSNGGGNVVLSNKVDEKDIIEYNRLVPSTEKLRKYDPSDKKWNIPDEFKTLTYEDILFIIAEKHSIIVADVSEFEREMRNKRLEIEFIKFVELDLLFLLQLIVYIIYEFERREICWGVGRGSSVASYTLYVLGIHDIDSYKYRLDMSDFFKK